MSTKIKLKLIYLIATVSMVTSLVACKPKNEDSELHAVTKTGSFSKTDLTTYKGANATVFAGMKKEMTKAKFDYNKMATALAKTKLKGAMKKDEAIALRLYTSSAYSAINKALRTQKASSIKTYANILKAAASGLNKIPASACTTKRGLDLPAAMVDKILKVKRFEEQGFMSTAPSVPAAFQKNITFIISSKTCRDISWLSEYPNEKEILFPPGSDFIVTKNTLKKSGSVYKGTLSLQHVVGTFKAVTSGTKQNVVPFLSGADKNDYPKLSSAKPKPKATASKTPAKNPTKTTKKTKLLGLTGEANDVTESADDGASDEIPVIEYEPEAEVDTEVPDVEETSMDFSGVEDEDLDLAPEADAPVDIEQAL